MTHDNEPEPDSRDPSRMSLPNVAEFLSHISDFTITLEDVRKDIANGAPTNADGSVNLIHYGAWLLKGMSHGA